MDKISCPSIRIRRQNHDEIMQETATNAFQVKHTPTGMTTLIDKLVERSPEEGRKVR